MALSALRWGSLVQNNHTVFRRTHFKLLLWWNDIICCWYYLSGVYSNVHAVDWGGAWGTSWVGSKNKQKQKVSDVILCCCHRALCIGKDFLHFNTYNTYIFQSSFSKVAAVGRHHERGAAAWRPRPSFAIYFVLVLNSRITLKWCTLWTDIFDQLISINSFFLMRMN